MLHFITGNKNKFEEVRQVLGMPMEMLSIELPEIQSLDAEKILREKLKAAEVHAQGDYIVEDTSLYLDCLNGELPGPLCKWFEKSIGNDGLVRLSLAMGETRALAKVLIGFANRAGEMQFFEGACRGTIVPSRGDKDFGWGPIFQPEGHEKTFGEMSKEEKNRISMRGRAATALRAYLQGIDK